MSFAREFWEWKHFSSLESTMDTAREQLPDLQEEKRFLLVSCDEQCKGRGRMGRVWESEPGALMFTLCWRSELSAEALLPLPLLAGLSVVETGVELFEKVFAEKVKLKWPNDLVTLQKQKLAGLLLECEHGRDLGSVYLGVGLNVVSAPKGACSLQGLGFQLESPEIFYRTFADF